MGYAEAANIIPCTVTVSVICIDQWHARIFLRVCVFFPLLEELGLIQ
jgi:hypothetical protein